MQALNVIVMILLIIGGLNWGLVGLFDFDLVAAIFGGTVGTYSAMSRIIFVIVGAAALYGFALLAPLTNRRTTDDVQVRR
jgi:uncharacterized protein